MTISDTECTGVYIIFNNKTNQSYIGSSINIKRRLIEHVKALQLGTHHSYKLQDAWNEYGGEAFYCMVFFRTKLIDLQTIEGVFIETLNPTYNVARTVSPVKYSSRSKGKNETINYSLEINRLKKLFPKMSPYVYRRVTEVCTIDDTQLSLW